MSSHQEGSKTRLSSEKLTELTIELINGHYQNGKPRKIGLEVELPFIDNDTLQPIPFHGSKSITAVFKSLCKRGQWSPSQIENGNVTELAGKMGNVTLEPGGQIEFASAPKNSLTELAEDLHTYLEGCHTASDELGINAAPFGFHPHLSIDECPYVSERSRFKALKPVFEAERGYSAWGQSCSVQLTLDSPSLDGAFDAFKLGLKLQPLAAAIFANSPFAMGEDSGFKSWRRKNLLSIDSPLYKVPDNLFDKDFTIKEWAEHVLHIPMSFIVRNEQYIAVAPHPFAEMVGKPLPELAHLPEDQQYLTHEDLLDHLTGIKPEMLLKPNLLLEFRAVDLGPSPQHWLGMSALWTGLFYDAEAYKKVTEYTAQWGQDSLAVLHADAAKLGLNTSFAGTTAQKAALDILAIAREGLNRIEPDAVRLLDTIERQIVSGMTPADEALRQFQENGSDICTTIKQSFLFKPASAPGTVKKSM